MFLSFIEYTSSLPFCKYLRCRFLYFIKFSFNFLSIFDIIHFIIQQTLYGIQELCITFRFWSRSYLIVIKIKPPCLQYASRSYGKIKSDDSKQQIININNGIICDQQIKHRQTSIISSILSSFRKRIRLPGRSNAFSHSYFSFSYRCIRIHIIH